MSVFQFAETVEQDAFEDEKQKHDLEVCTPLLVARGPLIDPPPEPNQQDRTRERPQGAAALGTPAAT